MRTKTLLLTAAIMAAGLGASMAQVYSVNAVGYVNLNIKAGYNLIANPLNATNNNVNSVIPVAPPDSIILTWDAVAQGFGQAQTYFEGNGWLNPLFEPSTLVINPGQAFFLRNGVATPTNLTFVGEVPQGANLTNPIAPLYGFYSSVVPQSTSLGAMGFPAVVDMTYTSWNPLTQQYVNTLTYIGVQAGYPSGWADAAFNPADPTPAVGEGFLIRNPGGTAQWTRSFSVN